jgi:hypothetical protein
MIAFVRQVYKLLFVHIIEGEPFSFVDDVLPRGVPIETKDDLCCTNMYLFQIIKQSFPTRSPYQDSVSYRR